ncbi:unnamed protein product, partial [Mesorhabditis belari]|uniref:Autophagy-related protein 16 domain-containing protein n=1 Tax=Mesorhabditis belari TaxID=2138241 RepID=A0AAF3E8V6_9BILA
MTQEGTSSSPIVDTVSTIKEEEALVLETVPSTSSLPSTPTSPIICDFRNEILSRLEDASARVRQFEPIFAAYSDLCEELKNQKKQRSGSVVHQDGVFDVSSAQLEALRNELSEVYKKKSINDQALLDHKKELEESRRQLLILQTQKASLEAEREKFMRRIAELEVALAKVTEEKTTIHDEWLALNSSCLKLNEKLVELDQDRVALITRIRDLQQQQATALNDEVDRHAALQRRKIQEDIAAALASTDLEGTSGDSEKDESNSKNCAYMPIGDVLPERQCVKFEANDGEVTDVIFLKETMAATAGSDKKIILWRCMQGGRVQRIAALTGCNQTVTRLDVNMEDEKMILGASNDHTVRAWNVENQRMMFTLSGHGDKVTVARFYCNQQVVSGSYDRMIKTWDIRSQRCTKSLFPGSTVLDLIVNRSIFISGHFDKKLRVWDGRTAEAAHIVEMGGKVTGLHRTSDDNQLLVLSRDDTLSLLDIRSLQQIHIYSAEQFRTAGDSVRCVVSPAMTYCAAGSSDGQIFIWNLRTTKLEKILYRNGHESTSVLSLAWAPHGRGLMSCDRHKTVCYWE